MYSVQFKEKLQNEISLLAEALNMKVKKNSIYCIIQL